MVKSYVESAKQETTVVKSYVELASQPYKFEEKHVLWLLKHRRYNLAKLQNTIIYLAKSEARLY